MNNVLTQPHKEIHLVYHGSIEVLFHDTEFLVAFVTVIDSFGMSRRSRVVHRAVLVNKVRNEFECNACKSDVPDFVACECVV